jgi:prolyl-tRNA synthetase
VLFDDREGVSPGVRFKDAELIGVPTIVVCGRGISDDPADSLVEVKDRRSGERDDVPLADVVGRLSALA